MFATMDEAGRIVIPKAIRAEAGLRAGVPIEIQVRAGRVEVGPAPRRVALRVRSGFLVAEALDEGPVRTAEGVRRTRAGIS